MTRDIDNVLESLKKIEKDISKTKKYFKKELSNLKTYKESALIHFFCLWLIAFWLTLLSGNITAIFFMLFLAILALLILGGVK